MYSKFYIYTSVKILSTDYVSRKPVDIMYVFQFPTSASIKLLPEGNYSSDLPVSVKVDGHAPPHTE